MSVLGNSVRLPRNGTPTYVLPVRNYNSPDFNPVLPKGIYVMPLRAYHKKDHLTFIAWDTTR